MVLVDRVTQVTDLSVRSGVAASDQLPESVIVVVSDEENGLALFEHLPSLHAHRPEQPMPQPSRTPVALEDEVDHPPDERQVLVRACLVGGEIGAALRH